MAAAWHAQSRSAGKAGEAANLRAPCCLPSCAWSLNSSQPAAAQVSLGSGNSSKPIPLPLTSLAHRSIFIEFIPTFSVACLLPGLRCCCGFELQQSSASSSSCVQRQPAITKSVAQSFAVHRTVTGKTSWVAALRPRKTGRSPQGAEPSPPVAGGGRAAAPIAARGQADRCTKCIL